MKSKYALRVISLLILLFPLFPVGNADAQSAVPPVDMFQLPWEQGEAWVALDGLDNGSRRPPGSPHIHLIMLRRPRKEKAGGLCLSLDQFRGKAAKLRQTLLSNR